MKQKTFRLYKDDFGRNPFPAKVGERYILTERCAESEVSGKGDFDLREDKGGIGGNMNREVKRYHGWRGTSYGVATYAHGLREVIKVSEAMEDEDGKIYQKVTVGKDLLPDVE